MRNTIVNVTQPPNLLRSLFHLQYPASEKQATSFVLQRSHTLSHYVYVISCTTTDVVMWFWWVWAGWILQKKISVGNIPHHVETRVLPLLLPLPHSFISPVPLSLSLSYHHLRLDCTWLLGLFLLNQFLSLSPLISSPLTSFQLSHHTFSLSLFTNIPIHHHHVMFLLVSV